MRAALTMLGVIIGVASVIATFAIGPPALRPRSRSRSEASDRTWIMVFSGR